MSRIPTPAAISDAPAAAQPLLNALKAKIGAAPNLYRLTAHSPAALEGLIGLSGALANGALNAATRERLALAVANINGCDYCNAAHSYLAKNVAGLDEAEIARNRAGASADAKADAALGLAVKIVNARGGVSEEDITAARDAGLGDAELVEVVAHVALNTFTNYLNEVFATEIDFPSVKTPRAA